MSFLTDNQLLCMEQFGFRPGHSTELADLRLVDHLTNEMDNFYNYDYDYEMVLLRHTISTMYHGIIFKSCKNTIYYNEVRHRRTNKESVLSADVGPPETNIIYRSKCNMSIYIIIGGYIIKIEIWFT